MKTMPYKLLTSISKFLQMPNFSRTTASEIKELIPSGLLRFLIEKMNLVDEPDLISGDYLGNMLCEENLNYVQME